MKKKSFLYGALLLTFSAVFSKILGAVYRIPLTNLLGSEGLGIYQMIFPVYSLLFVISSSGIPVAVSRLVSQEVARNNPKALPKILKNALILTGIVGLICTLLTIFGASVLAQVQGNALAKIGYFGIAPAILLGGIVAVFRGYFEGLQNMKPTAFSEVVEQIAKVSLGLLLAYYFLDKGLEYGVLGALLGITLGEIFSLLTILLIYFFTKKKYKKGFQIKEESFKENKLILEGKPLTIKSLFLESIPITLSGMIVPLSAFIDSLLIINLLTGVGFTTTISTSLFGIQAGVVNSLINLPMILAISISTAILPSLAASKTTKNIQDINFKSTFAIKTVWLIALPSFVGFLLLANDVTKLLYVNGLTEGVIDETLIASNLLRIISASLIYHSFLRIFIAILHALNKSFIVVKNMLIATAIKIIFTVLLVSIKEFNIYGASIASTISYAIAAVFCLISVKKIVKLKISLREFVISPIFALSVMVGSVLIFRRVLSNFVSSGLTTFLVIVIGAIIYFVSLILLKTFTKEEINSLAFFKKLIKRRKKQT